jgi:adenylate kinase family enzyme
MSFDPGNMAKRLEDALNIIHFDNSWKPASRDNQEAQKEIMDIIAELKLLVDDGK